MHFSAIHIPPFLRLFVEAVLRHCTAVLNETKAGRDNLQPAAKSLIWIQIVTVPINLCDQKLQRIAVHIPASNGCSEQLKN
jgi:hypothetical protein